MSKTIKNIITILGIITVVFGGYYLYTQMLATETGFISNEQSMQDMLNSTRVFIERGNTLNNLELDIAVLENSAFRSKTSFSEDIDFREPGNKENIFELPPELQVSQSFESNN